jgi:hypothetical protein
VVGEWDRLRCSKPQLMLILPPNSPDLILPENVWAYVQRQVDVVCCITVDHFKQPASRRVLAEMAAVPLGMLSNFYNSMPRRLAQYMSKNGGNISC